MGRDWLGVKQGNDLGLQISRVAVGDAPPQTEHVRVEGVVVAAGVQLPRGQARIQDGSGDLGGG